MKGFFGKIRLIDLNEKRFATLPVSDDMLSGTLGGKGLATRLLMDMNPLGVDPMSPENRIIFATGPATGTRLWGSSRYGVFT